MMEEEVEPEPEPEEPMVEEVPETRPGEEVEMETEVTPTGEGTMDTDNDGVIDANDHCPNTPTGARVNEKGCWVIQIVFFEYDKAVVRSQFYEGLNDLAETLKQNPNIKIEIQGNTCDIGSAPYNYRLSVRRANSVKKYLMDKGVASDRLKVVGLGFTNPMVPNINEANRKKNRRVEFKPIR
jgi:OOP family OmpA-OmpF porin